MKKKNSVVSADSRYAQVIGDAVLAAMQSKGIIRPGGKVMVTITMHLPEESADDLEGDDLMVAKLSDFVKFPRSVSTALRDYGNIYRVYQLISLTEEGFSKLRMVGPRSIDKIRAFLEEFKLKLGTMISPEEMARLRSLHPEDEKPKSPLRALYPGSYFGDDDDMDV